MFEIRSGCRFMYIDPRSSIDLRSIVSILVAELLYLHSLVKSASFFGLILKFSQESLGVFVIFDQEGL